jgi:hypothetical protein
MRSKTRLSRNAPRDFVTRDGQTMFDVARAAFPEQQVMFADPETRRWFMPDAPAPASGSLEVARGFPGWSPATLAELRTPLPYRAAWARAYAAARLARLREKAAPTFAERCLLARGADEWEALEAECDWSSHEERAAYVGSAPLARIVARWEGPWAPSLLMLAIEAPRRDVVERHIAQGGAIPPSAPVFAASCRHERLGDLMRRHQSAASIRAESETRAAHLEASGIHGANVEKIEAGIRMEQQAAIAAEGGAAAAAAERTENPQR